MHCFLCFLNALDPLQADYGESAVYIHSRGLPIPGSSHPCFIIMSAKIYSITKSKTLSYSSSSHSISYLLPVIF